MSVFRDWLRAQHRRRVPLVTTDVQLVVATQLVGGHGRRVLRRHPEMEAAIIAEVETGLAREGWLGFLYVMGWGASVDAFIPLYVGKAGRAGKKQALSANLVNLRGSKGKFARWGDGTDYHVGDLSHVLFGWDAYRAPQEKYRRWAEMPFEANDPPRLRQQAHLVLVPWYSTSLGPSKKQASIEQVEEELIELGIAEFEYSILNVAGEVWWAPEASTAVRLPTHYVPRRPIRVVDTEDLLAAALHDLGEADLIGVDVETDRWTQQLCLVQLSTANANWVIDPLAVPVAALGVDDLGRARVHQGHPKRAI